MAETILANHDWSCAIITDGLGQAGHPGFIDYWQQVAGPMTRARHWCEVHHGDLLAAAG